MSESYPSTRGCADRSRATDKEREPPDASPKEDQPMLSKLSSRLAPAKRDEGFTLIELLVVIIVLGILLAIAILSYLRFRVRANKGAAQANGRVVVRGI